MSVSGAQPGHYPRHDGVRPHLPAERPTRDDESLEKLVERQSLRIARLEGILRKLSTAESWALAWARENEPWKQIQRVLDE